jgi:autotransporter-associated beta strand protein
MQSLDALQPAMQHGARVGRRLSLRRAAALVAFTCLTGGAAYAQNATWNGSTTDWNTSTNWTPNTVPSGTATFSATGSTAVDNASGLVAIGAIAFDATAQAYSFTIENPFLVNGTGVANNSANTQAFEVTSGANLVFQNASTANSGTGAVSYTADSGGFIFFNNTSNAGNANTTYTNNGIIQFEDGSSAGSANFTNNTELDFFDSTTAASSTITNSATGTVTFNNTATAGTATIDNSGALDFNNSSSAGSAFITNLSGGTIVFSNSSTGGSSIIANASGGTLTFNDTSSAGGQINNSGTTTFNNSSNAGSGAINNFTGATLTFNDTSSAGSVTIFNQATATFNNSSTAGNASITNSSGGTLTFNDTSTAGSAAIMNVASMAFNNSASAGSATITNLGPTGSLTFNNSTTAGTANITNDSTLTFNNSSNAGSATIVNNESAAFNNSADAGSAIITNNLTLTFNNSSTADTATITTNSPGTTSFTGSSTGGNARFITNAGGTFDMSGLTDGGMTAGSIEGAGSYILGGNALTVGSNNLSTTVSGVISGVGGSLIKTGSGTLTLTNTETYTGATTIDAGALMVNGSIVASSGVTVNSGGTLEGTGTVSSTTVNSGGTFMPGNGTPGTSMTVSGSLAFMSGAMYLVQVSPATASFASVTGTATLNGTVDAVFAPGTYTQKQYTILMANGGINGTFTALETSNLPANITASLSYSADDAFLNLKASLPTTGLNVNQQNVANALNTFFNNGGALPPSFFSIFNLTGSALANALTQLDGEVATGADKGAFLLMNEFLGVMLDPFVDGRIAGPSGPIGFAPDQEAAFPSDVALAYAGVLKAPPPATFTQRWTAWGSAYGGGEFTQGNAVIGSNNVNAQASGFAGGMDYHLTPDTVVGFGLSGGETGWTLAQGLGTGRSDAFQAGLYGVSHAGPAYVAAAVAVAEHWMSTSRVALGDSLTASFNAQAYGGRLEAGYRYGAWSGVGFAPYAAVQVEEFHAPAYSEADLTGGGFGLSYAAQDATDTRSELGVRLDNLTTFDGMPLMLRARLAWAHDWTTNPALNAVFEALPGANFVVNGAATPPNSALVTVGSELRLTPQWTLLTKFDGQFASTGQTYAGSGTLRYSW